MLLVFGLLFRNFNLELPKDIPTKQFQNLIDHFNISNHNTYDQRYYENLSFIPADGFTSALLYFGGEGPLGTNSVLSGSHIPLAQKLNAAMFGLEHRFFGDSQPFGDLELEHLKYLTIDQAMADLSKFISDVILKHKNAAKNTKIRIGVIGGSYPGALSSWFRLKYPQFAFASWASSAPIFIKNDFTEYDEHVASELDAVSHKCLANTKSVLEQVAKKAFEDTEKLRKDFGFLDDEQPNDMVYCVTDILAAMVQYNSILKLLTQHCELQSNGPNYEGLVSIINQTCQKLGQPISSSNLRLQTNTSVQSPFASGRSWSYMTCNEVGWFQTASGKLRPALLDLSYFEGICKDLFGFESLADENEKNCYFGGANPQQSRVFFLHGSVDPWSKLGVNEADGSIMRRFVTIANESHCSDLYSISDNDSDALRQAKEDVIQQMAEWLQVTNCTGLCAHGKCTPGGCVCDNGYAGSTCELEVKKKSQYNAVVISIVCALVLIVVIAIFASWFISRLRKKHNK